MNNKKLSFKKGMNYLLKLILISAFVLQNSLINLPSTAEASVIQSVVAIGRVTLQEAHTVALLAILGGSEVFGKSLQTYLNNGDVKAYYEAVGIAVDFFNSTKLFEETANNTSLWLQILGSKIVGGGVSLVKNGAKIQASRTLVLHSLGFVNFFGWEFGKHLFNATMRRMSFAPSIPNNNLDFVKQIYYLFSSTDRMKDFLNSVQSVLLEEEEIKKLFLSSVKSWLNFNLFVTYETLHLGSKAGSMTSSSIMNKFYSKSGALNLANRSAKVAPALRNATASIFLRLGYGSLATISGFMTSLISIIGLTLFVSLTPLEDLIEKINETVIDDTIISYKKQKLFALSEKLEPVWLSDYSLEKAKENKEIGNLVSSYKETRDSIIGDHLSKIKASLKKILPPLTRTLELMYKFRLQANILTGNVAWNSPSNESEKKIKSHEIAKIHDIIITEIVEDCKKILLVEKELQKVRALTHGEWGEYRNKILNGVNFDTEVWIAAWKPLYQTVNKVEKLTTSEAELLLSKEIEKLKLVSPFPMVEVTNDDTKESKPLYKWMEGHLTVSNNDERLYRNNLIAKGVRILKSNLLIQTNQITGMLESFSKSKSAPYSNYKKYIENLNPQPPHSLVSSMFKFIKEYFNLRQFLGSLNRNFLRNSPNASEKAIVNIYATELNKLQNAMSDLFDWEEGDYHLIMNKISFFLNIDSDYFNSEDFLLSYEIFSSLKKTILNRSKAEYREALETYLQVIWCSRAEESGVEYSILCGINSVSKSKIASRKTERKGENGENGEVGEVGEDEDSLIDPEELQQGYQEINDFYQFSKEHIHMMGFKPERRL